MQAVTAAYNLMWGCKRYDYDADVELFINVIQVPRRFGTNIHKKSPRVLTRKKVG